MNPLISIALNNVDLLKHTLYKDYHFPSEIDFINRTQERILMTIKYSNNLTMVTIARAIGLEKGPFSQSVDKLEKLDLVTRVRAEKDKRQVYLQLTKKGEEITAIVERSMEDHFQNSMQKLSESEKQSFLSALEILKETANIISSK